jgi:hypothetical protein
MTFFVCCLSFGQDVGMPGAPEIRVKKLRQIEVEGEKTPERDGSLIIDLSKFKFDKTGLDNIESEIRQGPSSGGGGNSCALMLKKNTTEILEMIQYYPPFQRDSVGEVLVKKIKEAQFHMGENLHIHGKKVEAINYPIKNKIVIEQSFCDMITNVTPASIGITLHEYLGLAGFDDSNYHVSDNFVSTLYLQQIGKKAGAVEFKNPVLNKLREKFRTSSKNIRGNLEADKFSTTCTYYSENDDIPVFQAFIFTKTSATSAEIVFMDQKNGLLDLDSKKTVTLTHSTQAFGIIAALPLSNERSTSYLVLRQSPYGGIVGEWTVSGNTSKENEYIKLINPVPSLSMPGAFATAYSLCSQSPMKLRFSGKLTY